MSNLLTEKQLCDVLHVGRVFLYMCRDRGMPYVRLGAKLVRYDYEKVMAWMEDYNKNNSKGWM